jgi:PadR family transcriptional regulator, regulatory protein PadR
MPRQSIGEQVDPHSGTFLPGTLEMLILKTLSRRPMHGYGIAETIRQTSEDVLKVGEGSLYPALQKLLIDECVTAEWGLSENNRRARIYTITPAGRKHLQQERLEFAETIAGILRVMEAR